jgi:hypothetical protein
VAPLPAPQLPRHHERGEQRERPDQPHHQGQPFAQHPLRAGLGERRAARLPGAPGHEPSSDDEEDRPQKKTPARDPHGRLLSQGGAKARASQVYEIAKRYWGQTSDPKGWTVEFGIEPIAHVDHDVSGAAETHTVDGLQYFGWACPQHRLIIVQPFAGADCMERSVIFHELGHAWGVREGDPRLYGEYFLMREAMEATAWAGCTGLPENAQ